MAAESSRAAAPVVVRQGDGVATLRQLPPGFRFRPTDEELVVQYLRRKALGVPLPAAVIPVVRDLYSLDPWDIPNVPAPTDAAGEGEKYFFALRPAGGGGRCAAGRATASGRWKPAGKEKAVVLPRPCGGGSLLVGVKTAMAFAPRPPRRKKTKLLSPAPAAQLASGWVMHEYRLAAPLHKNGCSLAQAEGEWVVCRVFQKSRPRRRAAPAAAASPSPSSASSCVTDGSDQDQEEVSS
ncbi:hypothetical protein U9M48_038078 [Paspalum notatum var. saurae]|uniref:NAC domain-containing protein n=1 Tax=Paspalum notatum var. saurae TaxID=547442 RepID=A0AAQ3XBS2_PASNO